jgi:hypothetical protein
VQGSLQELAQAIFRIASVSGLTSKSLGKNDHFTPAGRTLTGQLQDPALQLRG